MSEKVCLVTGAGPGTGAAIARRFAKGGYRVALMSRNADRLRDLAGTIDGAVAFPADVADRRSLNDAVGEIGAALGPVDVIAHNAVAGIFGNFTEIDPDEMERVFRVNVIGLLNVAQLLLPDMAKRGGGALIATGNTSAWRGKETFAGFAPTKAAQRILCESIARSHGPKGIHVAYVTIDAVIDLEWTRKRFGIDDDDFYIQPDGIAETVWDVAHQPRSAWSFAVDVRPHGEKW